MRPGELCVTLRESHFGGEVFVTARKKDRLLDYYRFPTANYSQESAMVRLRERFRVANLAWAREPDEDFLHCLKLASKSTA